MLLDETEGVTGARGQLTWDAGRRLSSSALISSCRINSIVLSAHLSNFRGRLLIPVRSSSGRVTKMTMIAEGAEAKRVEEATEKRKRKIEDDKRWEGTSGASVAPQFARR